jgi:predicted alpha/beta-fold hydrolase
LALTTPQGFTAARYSDFGQAVTVVSEHFPSAPLAAIGFSLGAGILAKYVASEGKECRLCSAVCVSPSWDFSITSNTWEVWSRLKLVGDLKKWARVHMEQLAANPLLDMEKIMASKNVRDFDTHTIVPMFGYRDVDHYYEDSSAIHLSNHIHCPTLSITADDDPVCDARGCPTMGKGKLGPGLVVARTTSGGHVGWPEGLFPLSASWSDRVCVDWLQACFEDKKVL